MPVKIIVDNVLECVSGLVSVLTLVLLSCANSSCTLNLDFLTGSSCTLPP